MKGKIFAIILALILVITIIGSTLALVYFRSETTSVNLTFDSDLGKYINYKSGELIFDDDSLIPGNDYTSGLSTEIEFWKTTNAQNMDIFGHIYLDVELGSEELLNMEGLKWTVVSNNILISEGNFVGYSQGSSVPLLVNHKLLSSLTKFQIYVWIDENGLVNNVVSGEDFSITVRCEATSGEYENINDIGNEYIFNYTGDVQTINLNQGYYQVEVWGAQGGYGMNETYRGGYGGYSSGYINLSSSTDLYVVVGGQGGNGLEKVSTLNAGGYNGGGDSYGTTGKYVGSGGGATHIALSNGELSSLSENIDDILIVAGGGGAGGYESSTYNSTGGDAGGYVGNSGMTNNTSYVVGAGGTQSAGGTGYIVGSFGQGGTVTSDAIGGGGGFYGGGAGRCTSGSGGGSGYIGNSLLSDKVMYCYQCSESTDENIKTISTILVSDEAKSKYTKKGNGYAKISNLLSKPIKIISRKKITLGTDYDFITMASNEIGENLTIIQSTYTNANTLNVGEYQIRYVAIDSSNNEYIYYQKIDIIE